MKRNFVLLAICLITLIGVFDSCVSIQDRTMTLQERAEAIVLGSVTVDFNTFQFFHIPNKNVIKNKAYAELKKAAGKNTREILIFRIL